MPSTRVDPGCGDQSAEQAIRSGSPTCTGPYLPDCPYLRSIAVVDKKSPADAAKLNVVGVRVDVRDGMRAQWQ